MKIDIGIAAKDRKQIAAGLARLLADTYTLYLKTHGFHWNVTGPQFSTLHQMFMVQYTELWNALDEIAERMRALDVFAPASCGEFTKLATIPEETTVLPAEGMLLALVQAHEAVARTARATFALAERAHDQVTVDLLTQRLQTHEKSAWMLRSMLA